MSVRADTQIAYGLPDKNPALDDVLASLLSIEGERSRQLFFDPELRVSLQGHIQGIARVPTADGVPWFVLSKSQDHDARRAGFLWISYPEAARQGEALWDARGQGAWNSGRLAHFWGHSRSEHPGGLQQCGRLIVVAQDPERGESFVSIVDGQDPSRPSFSGRLVLDGSHGETVDGLTCTGLTRLDDGRTLLFAYRYASSRPEACRAHLFRSREVGLNAATRWDRIATLSLASGGLPARWKPEIENVALLNQRDGCIFLAALHGGVLHSQIDLYQLVADGPALSLRYRGHKQLRTMPGGGTLRAGGALHITPSRKLVIYAVQKEQGDALGNMLIEEFSG